MCLLGALRCSCGVLDHWASVHRCDCLVRCVVCVVSWATWLLFTCVPARCVVLRVPCPHPIGSCSPVCSLGALCCVCGVLGHLASVARCARFGRCVARAVSSTTGLLFTDGLAWCVVLRVPCPGPLGSCLLVCPLSVSCCVCGVLGHLAPVHPWARSVRCVACALSWTTWLLFTGVHAQHVVSRVRCPGPLGSCSPVCTLGVSCCVCRVIGHAAPVHRSPRSMCCAVWVRDTQMEGPATDTTGNAGEGRGAQQRRGNRQWPQPRRPAASTAHTRPGHCICQGSSGTQCHAPAPRLGSLRASRGGSHWRQASSTGPAGPASRATTHKGGGIVGKRLQLRLLSDTLTGEWRKGQAGEGQGSEPREPGGLRDQAAGEL